jgi:hypothetical protein
MLDEAGLVWCDGCGVEIFWGPVVTNERHYCCLDCRDGLKCECATRQEIDVDERRTEA